MKLMFSLKLFIFKNSKIISHFKKMLAIFLYATFFYEYLCIMQNTQCFWAKGFWYKLSGF